MAVHRRSDADTHGGFFRRLLEREQCSARCDLTGGPVVHVVSCPHARWLTEGGNDVGTLDPRSAVLFADVIEDTGWDAERDHDLHRPMRGHRVYRRVVTFTAEASRRAMWVYVKRILARWDGLGGAHVVTEYRMDDGTAEVTLRGYDDSSD